MSLILNWQLLAEGETKLVNIQTEFAVLQLIVSGRVIRESSWQLQRGIADGAGTELSQQLRHYLENPDGLQLTLNLQQQGSEFSRRVWIELGRIPFGETVTYSQLAERLNSGARAVANACRNNSFPGIIPCHRVVSANGIGGFMGQSHGEFVELKRRILHYEVAKRQQTELG